MKIVPYRDTDDQQMKKALLPQTQEEGALIELAIRHLSINPPEGVSAEDLDDLAKMLQVIEDAAHTNPLAMSQ